MFVGRSDPIIDLCKHLGEKSTAYLIGFLYLHKLFKLKGRFFFCQMNVLLLHLPIYNCKTKFFDMALALYGIMSLYLGMSVALGPMPRISWEHKEVHLVHFQDPEISNYSTLLLDEDRDILYVGAREVIFALNSFNIVEIKEEVFWKVTEDKKTKCAEKGKSKQTECLNYVRVLQYLNDTLLYVCGTNAFQPICDHLVSVRIKFI
ncbi:PREDICTED: semaphorin-4D-like [Thamnophis sirtalis]|uniref:Semaphorin-4D-like n=1 Tax=Thamnophis sirtalis TaxID=35019 RepID=A0A6I9XI41_9SAUR|nr:PREDICTED: semaphorin-4D-like [Thamnophis sirtalis]XP_013915425.1 PREDICTED: semaphorin-4D-like [Thamnophis sirtalis]